MNEFATYNNNSGVFEQGVPARNLSEDEWNEIPEETRKRLLKDGVYKINKKQTKKDGE